MFFLSYLRDCLRRGRGAHESYSSDLFFDLQTLEVATDFFSESNKLGHGGFGPVYKGLLGNGEQVAIKKLALTSSQGKHEFINEVKLLLKTQHKNLVMLLGCCAQGPENMLVYEYLPNKSLDYILFDKQKSASLHWTQRFQIIVGVIKGLIYLHEDAPVRIIHRDIKASNILLDDKLDPKISDFGLARLFPGDDTHMNTLRISGTLGYMSPEYAIHGYLSTKADVYSFGVLMLEIVSGRRLNDIEAGDDLLTYVSQTWSLFQSGKQLELVDETLDTCNTSEALMCIHLGLLCCQASVADRPDMNTLHLMISNDSFTLPIPRKPGFPGCGGRWAVTTNSSVALATTIHSNSLNYVQEFSVNSISNSSINQALAPGHMIPLVQVARLFACRGVRSTIITTINNTPMIKTMIERDIDAGYSLIVLNVDFPASEVGLPVGIENSSACTNSEMAGAIFDDAIKLLACQSTMVEHMRRNLKELSVKAKKAVEEG
ncbi:hypothetical protein QVD17_14708 [Tagetes erecta]|uniref:Protein kinase domain-containing protein n=1 Tax=Tagetes erecta TaxID=13708 RepID=A0AAD8KUK1_TARER|nr:hypothetical protein QVD17_14708 [Tagetes erecta]